MHTTVLEGVIDRIFFNAQERLVYLKFETTTKYHCFRVGDNAAFRVSVMLTKPGDEVVLQLHHGRLDHWRNHTWEPAVLSEKS